jgi:hypothetical protein
MLAWLAAKLRNSTFQVKISSIDLLWVPKDVEAQKSDLLISIEMSGNRVRRV